MTSPSSRVHCKPGTGLGGVMWEVDLQEPHVKKQEEPQKGAGHRVKEKTRATMNCQEQLLNLSHKTRHQETQ